VTVPSTGAPDISRLERTLAALWASVLGLDHVGVTDTFANLGGGPAGTTRLLAAVNAAFGVALQESAFADGGATVRTVAELVRAALRPGPANVVPRRPDDAPAPLTFGQLRLWALHELLPGSTAYHVPLAFHLRGEVDEDALAEAVRGLVGRHEALRSRLVVEDGEPAQVVTEGTGIWLRVSDVDGGFASAAALAARDARRPFDLERGPLTRALLVRCGQAESLFVLTMHHLVTDGWSNEIIVRELTARYAAGLHGTEPDLPPRPARYADFAAWQREHLTGDVLADGLSWWRERLRGLPAPLRFGAGRRPAVPDTAGRSIPFTIGEETTLALRTLAREERTTLFVTLLASCQSMLARFTGTTDIVVGTPSAGRSTPEVEGTVGFFVTTVPMRADCSGDPEFRAVVRQARDWVVSAHDHQDVPLEQLLKEVAPGRDLSFNPLAQVFVGLEGEDGVPAFPGVSALRLENLEAAAAGDLEIHFHEGKTAISGHLVHATATVAGETAAALADTLPAFLDCVGRHPGRRLSQTPMTQIGVPR
jgi:hypothetical protein